MAIIDVKLIDKEELTLNAESVDFLYIKREVAGGGFQATDYKIMVRNLLGTALPYSSEGAVPTPGEGEMYFDTTTKKLRVFDGTVWTDLN